MHSTIHAVCGQQKGQNRAKSHVWLIFKKKKKKKKNLVKRAGRHFGFFKRAGRHEKGAGRRALQKKPRQNTGMYDVWCTPRHPNSMYSLRGNKPSLSLSYFKTNFVLTTPPSVVCLSFHVYLTETQLPMWWMRIIWWVGCIITSVINSPIHFQVQRHICKHTLKHNHGQNHCN